MIAVATAFEPLNSGRLARPAYRFLLALPVLLLAPIYGIWPLDHLMGMGLMLPVLGFIECLSEAEAWLYCPLASLGEPHARSYGLPVAQLAASIRRFGSVELLAAWNLASLIVLYIAGLGAQGFLRAMKVDYRVAVPASMLFLGLPVVFAKTGYPLMLWGFALLPAVLWAQLIGWQWKSHLAAFSLLAFVLTLAMFQEPYSLVMALTFGGWLAIGNLVVGGPERPGLVHRVVRALVWVAAAVSAVLLYQFYIPGGADYQTMPIEYFRGQGIDLIALIARNPDLYALGPIWGVGGLERVLYFTDGEMTAHSYLGAGLLIGLIGFLALLRPWRRLLHAVLLVSVVGAIVMALGPSLKINSTAQDRLPDDPITFDSYLMPAETAVTGLPHAFLYDVTPFSKMRSVSRWYLLVALGLVTMLSLFVQALGTRGRFGLAAAVALSAWVVVEYWPNVDKQQALGGAFGNSYRQLEAEAVGELSELLRPEERVAFISGERYRNEYFTTFLCARAACTTFNVSGDKPREIAIASWPEDMRRTLARPSEAKERAALLDRGYFDVLVVPHFDLRWNSYAWPPSEEQRLAMKSWADAYRDLDGIEVTGGRWFTTIRSGVLSGPEAEEGD